VVRCVLHLVRPKACPFAGLSPAALRRIDRRYDIAVMRASGAMFVGFALHALYFAVPGLFIGCS
jgi:hypothetical protein